MWDRTRCHLLVAGADAGADAGVGKRGKSSVSGAQVHCANHQPKRRWVWMECVGAGGGLGLCVGKGVGE